MADWDPSEAVRGEALAALAVESPDEALARIGQAMRTPELAPYAVRALEIVARRHPDRLRQFHDDDAPPRAAAVIDALGLLEGR